MEIRAEVAIEATAQAAWALIGEQFGDIGQWAGPILCSSVDPRPCAGAVRTCQIANFGPFRAGTIRERLLGFDPVAMTLTDQRAEGMPAFVTKAVNRWSVHSINGNRCIVRTTLQLR